LKAVASAPAKVILFGEHFVVYDQLAIVMAIDLHVHVTATKRSDDLIQIKSDLGYAGQFQGNNYRHESGGVEGRRILEPIKLAAEAVLNRLDNGFGVNLSIDSKIPMAVGLGSSGACAVATVAATSGLFGLDLPIEKMSQLPSRAEEFVHIKPSGIDQTISTYGGVIKYRRSEGITPLNIESEVPLVIGNTGKLRNTGQLVKKVRDKRERFPILMDSIINLGDVISEKAEEALKQGDMIRLGELMDINQGLLSAIDVSTGQLEELIFASRMAGALGAKLTGAGGGGCIVALSSKENQGSLVKAIYEVGGTAIIARKTDSGVRVVKFG
jgi:mevalonate kinase